MGIFHTSLILNDRLDDNLVGQDLVIIGTISNIPKYEDREATPI